MFIHNFTYAIKILFKNKMLIFWTFAFPIILGTFFSMAFSDIENSEQLDIIDIAIVDNDEFKDGQLYRESFNVLSDEDNDDRLFDIVYVTEDEAETLLSDGEITGYVILTDEPKVVVRENGINETVLKYVTEEISQTGRIVENIGMPQSAEANIKDVSDSNLSYTMIEFYTLIAMTCLYGGILGMTAVNHNLANMSNKGKRVSVSPIPKGRLILGSVLASYIVQLAGVALLLVYTVLVLKVDYGDNLLFIILLAMAGSLAGLTMGIAIAALIKAGDNAKTGIIISVTMLGCFLAGMMGITMKYTVDKNIPVINKINPAAIITDGFYALYYYDTPGRFWFNIASLLIFSFIMIAISIFSLRRQKYDSI